MSTKHIPRCPESSGDYIHDVILGRAHGAAICEFMQRTGNTVALEKAVSAAALNQGITVGMMQYLAERLIQSRP